MQNPWLLTAGILDAAASLGHLACIFGGPAWYRFFGAGERMARLAEQGSLRPTVLTLFIAAVLALWSAYALSGAGLFASLPLLRAALLAIATILLGRAAALPLLFRLMPDRSRTFLIVSSATVLLLGLLHAIGAARHWHELAP